MLVLYIYAQIIIEFVSSGQTLEGAEKLVLCVCVYIEEIKTLPSFDLFELILISKFCFLLSYLPEARSDVQIANHWLELGILHAYTAMVQQ